MPALATFLAITGCIALGLILLFILWGISRFIAGVFTYAERQCVLPDAYGGETQSQFNQGE